MIMRLAIAALATLVSLGASAAEVATVGPYTFHSSFWISLHETLMHCATAKPPCDLTTLTPEERAAWEEAVEVYRREYRDAGGRGSIPFVRPMAITHDVLTTVPDGEAAPKIREPLGSALLNAAPIYRRHFWPIDDRANRFWIGYVSRMIADAGDELAAGHTRVYGVPWPEAVRVDAAPYAVPFGGYTMMGRLAGVHETIASRDASNQGLAALELVVHEASHSLVGPRHGPVAASIARHAERLGVEPRGDLWHAFLFATSSELTRRALRERGLAYTPMSDDLFTRVWPEYREAFDAHWAPFVLEGKGTLDEAVGRIVEAVARHPER